jgi:hypothetical protein
MATMRIIGVVVLAFAASCVRVSSEPVGPNQFAVTASGPSGKVLAASYKEANRICPAGFDVVDGNRSTSVGYIGQSSTNASANCTGGYCSGQSTTTGSAMPVARDHLEMIIQCRAVVEVVRPKRPVDGDAAVRANAQQQVDADGAAGSGSGDGDDGSDGDDEH